MRTLCASCNKQVAKKTAIVYLGRYASSPHYFHEECEWIAERDTRLVKA